MQFAEFSPSGIYPRNNAPDRAPEGGFVWLFLDREELAQQLPAVQLLAQRLGGAPLHELHCHDLLDEAHPSDYDDGGLYDLILFQRLTQRDGDGDTIAHGLTPATPPSNELGWPTIHTQAIGFVIFERLLISVHAVDCISAHTFLQAHVVDEQPFPRYRLPTHPADLMLRLVNQMVSSYLALRRPMNLQLDHWQQELLHPSTRFANWRALMEARNQLILLEDLCEEQQVAMQEWLSARREQATNTLPAAEEASLLARGRDVLEHIERVVRHVQRLQQGAETAVQLHFSAQSNRTNDIMRTLTVLTAVFLPLNLIAGIFGMNFDDLPLIRNTAGFWLTIGTMVMITVVLVALFWRLRYLARSQP